MTIASAIDYINDKLAGSDQPSAQTIEQAIMLLADNISGGGSIPIASADTLGGIKVGENLSITEGGVLSASGCGGGGALVCNVTFDEVAYSYTLDKTAGEILTAFQNGYSVWCKTDYGDDGYTLSIVGEYGEDDQGHYFFAESERTYYADTENDYPVAT